MKKIARYVLQALPFVLLMGLISSFSYDFSERITGSGNVKSENRNTSSFTEVSTSAVFKVVITQGNTHSIKVEAEDNLLPYILTDISGNELEIRAKSGVSINPTRPVTVYVTLQKVEKLAASGASGITCTNKLKADRLGLSLSGAAAASLEVDASKLVVDLSGASNIKLKGNSSSASYSVSGAADIAAADLESDNVTIGISGSGKANVFAQKKLDVSVSGMGKVKYKGEPVITQAISGMGKISHI